MQTWAWAFCTGCTNQSAKQVHGVFVREKEEVEGESEQEEEPGGKDEREKGKKRGECVPLWGPRWASLFTFQMDQCNRPSCFLGLRRCGGMQRSFNGFKYHQGSIATRLIIQFIVTEPTDLQANSLCCLPVLHFFNSAPTPFFRCPLPIFAPSSPVASGSRPPPLFHLPVAYILLCTSFSVCQFILYIYTFPFPPPPLLLFFQHPLLHLLLLLTPSQRCNSTPHIHSVISRSSDVRTSIPQIMCASIFIIFFGGGGGWKVYGKRRLGWEIAHTVTARTPAATVFNKKTPIVPQKSKLGSYSTEDKTKVCFTPNMRESGLWPENCWFRSQTHRLNERQPH